MARLYIAEKLRPKDFRVGACLSVSGSEARHAIRVARLRQGEKIAVSNGAGYIAWGSANVSGDCFTILVDNVDVREPVEPRLVLAQALAKGGRDELAAEQATELGVAAVLPWQGERSTTRVDARATDSKNARAEKILRRFEGCVREAAKQSIRASVPKTYPVSRSLTVLLELLSARNSLTADPSGVSRDPEKRSEVTVPASQTEDSPRSATEQQKRRFAGARLVIVLHPGQKLPGAQNGTLQDALHSKPDTQEIVYIVGPEGGFSAAELAKLVAAECFFVRLGENILRTSSAGPAAIAATNFALGRWG